MQDRDSMVNKHIVKGRTEKCTHTAWITYFAPGGWERDGGVCVSKASERKRGFHWSWKMSRTLCLLLSSPLTPMAARSLDLKGCWAPALVISRLDVFEDTRVAKVLSKCLISQYLHHPVWISHTHPTGVYVLSSCNLPPPPQHLQHGHR